MARKSRKNQIRAANSGQALPEAVPQPVEITYTAVGYARLSVLETRDRKDNEALLVCLGEKLKKSGTHQVLPVLGAGISVPAGIPTWDRLLDNMWYRQMVIDLAGSPFPDDALRNRLASANTE